MIKMNARQTDGAFGAEEARVACQKRGHEQGEDQSPESSVWGGADAHLVRDVRRKKKRKQSIGDGILAQYQW
jgi:hypothetical protein